MNKDYRGALIRAVYPPNEQPTWVADDPLVKDATRLLKEGAEHIAELDARIAAIESDAEAYRKLCEMRQRHPGIPCACEFDYDGETILEWCEFHREIRDDLHETKAALEQAPHAVYCSYARNGGEPCDCYKRFAGDALEKKDARIAELERERDEVRLERERLRAANSVHMQTLAIISRWTTDGFAQGWTAFAKERMQMADAAAKSARLEDCVTVQLNSVPTEGGEP